MVRVLHTADLHLDTRFTGSGLGRDKVLQRRSDLVAVFRQITELAASRHADLLLIAGDLFEDEYVNQATLERVFAAIAGLSPIPVLISPGNHDPCQPASPYLTEQLPANLRLFRSDSVARMDFPGLNTAVFGVGFKTHRESRNLLKGFRVSDGALVNILLAHGELMTAIGAEGPVYAPIDEADLRLCGADYCALGHYHRARDVFSDGRGLRAAYPGSPEPLCYGESGDFGVLMLEIEAGGSISVERIATQRRRYHDIEVDAGDCADAAELDHAVRHALSGLDFHGDFIELTLRGSLPPGLEFKPADFSDLLETAFDYRISDQTRPAYDLDAIAGENNARGAFCRNVMNRAADAGVEAGERELLDEALKLGLAAFDGREVGEIPL